MTLALPYLENGESYNLTRHNKHIRVVDSPLHLSHEINIASMPSGYTLKPHYQAILDGESENIIKVVATAHKFILH